MSGPRIVAFVCLLLIAMPRDLAARVVTQPVVPATNAGRALTRWLAAFDTLDRHAYTNYAKANFPSDLKDVDGDVQLRAMSGGFDLRDVLHADALSIVALVQERLGERFARITIALDPKHPTQIASLDAGLVPRPAQFALPHLSQAAFLDGVTAKFARQSATGRFAGAAIVSRDGTPIFAHAYGLADRARNVPNTLDTRFRIGSMNKMFTAVAILQLVQAGKIALDEPLGTYVTDYPNRDAATHVTIRNLLTHTGGTGDIFGPEFESHRRSLRTLDDYVKLYGKRKLEFKPGTRYAYSNYGFILLGVVIERATHGSYYDYVRDRVYGPAGMTSTGSEPEDVGVARRSIGYTTMASAVPQPNTAMLPYRGTSAGGGYSTVGDLVRFAAALQHHVLLDAAREKLLTTGTRATPSGHRYAMGFEDYVSGGTRCFGHGGGAPGMNGSLAVCPQAGYVVAVLANADPPQASIMSDYVTASLPK